MRPDMAPSSHGSPSIGGRYKAQGRESATFGCHPPEGAVLVSTKRTDMKGLFVLAFVAALCVAPFRAEGPPGVLRPLPRPGYGGVQTLPAPLPAPLGSSFKQTRPSYRPQIQPSLIQTKPLPRPVTLPAKLPEDLRQTRPIARPQTQPLPVVLPADLSSSGKQTKPLPRPVTLPAKLPEDLKQTRPVVRPQVQPAHPSGGVRPLPAVLPADLRGSGKQTKPLPRPVPLPAVDLKQTRPVARPSYHRPQVLPAYPSGGRQTLPAALPADLQGPRKQTRPVLRPSPYSPLRETEICRNCAQLSFVRRGACCKRWNSCC
nr:diacylglycerol kinase kappa-like [Penaeus vannamei]